MSKPDNFLTAQEFAQRAGVSAGTVSKWLRGGTIKGEKISGKWSISSDELAKVAKSGPEPASRSNPTAPGPKRQPDKAATTTGSFSIQEFCEMSYLTEFGVRKWLKEGRLKKVVDSAGQARVDASNLEDPHIKRLLR